MCTPRPLARVLFFALILIEAIASGTAQADPRHAQRRDDRGSDSRAMRDVVGEVEHNYRGHVVGVQAPTTDEDMYRVRVLQEGGRVKTVRVPARRQHERRHH